MALISPYDISYEKLKILQRSAQGIVELTLPERPSSSETDVNRYLNNSVSMLSDSATSMYGNCNYLDSQLSRIDTQIEKTNTTNKKYFDYLNRRFDKETSHQFDKIDQRFDKVDRQFGRVDQRFAKIDERFDKVDERFDKVDERLNKVDERFDKVDERLDKVDERFDKVDERLNKVDKRFDKVDERLDKIDKRLDKADQKFDDLGNQIKGVKRDLKAVRAMQLNSSTRALHASIEKVAVPVRDEKGQIKSEVAAGFPKTVRQFWLLQNEITTLISLANHYSVEGWEDWQIVNWDDSDETKYERLEDAVTAHPQSCLQALAAKWGLKYRKLEKTTRDRGQVSTLGQKRKTEDEIDSKRARRKLSSGCETEIAILSTSSEDIKIRRRITKFGPDMKVHDQMTLEQVIRQYDVPTGSDPREQSQELGWETSSSTRAARHSIQAKLGIDPPTPDRKRRAPRISPVRDEKNQ